MRAGGQAVRRSGGQAVRRSDGRTVMHMRRLIPSFAQSYSGDRLRNLPTVRLSERLTARPPDRLTA
jgi:hypothetical protein